MKLFPPWALPARSGENSSASGSEASVLGELYAQFTQAVFIQCSVFTESIREVDLAEY